MSAHDAIPPTHPPPTLTETPDHRAGKISTPTASGLETHPKMIYIPSYMNDQG